MVQNTNAINVTRIKNFQIVFHHCPNEILHTASPATVIPAVGLIIFVNILEYCNTVTADSGLAPIKSANGAISGIVNAACPDDEGTNTAIKDCAKYITLVNTALGAFPKRFTKLFKRIRPRINKRNG